MRRSNPLRVLFGTLAFATVLLPVASSNAQTAPPPEEAVEDAQDTERLDEKTATRTAPWAGEDEPEDYFGARPLRVVASTGFDFSTGDFGTTTESDIWYVPFGLKLEWEPFIVKLTVPYLRVDGDVAIVGGRPEAIPGLTGSRDGIGDIVLATSYVYYPGPSVSFLPLVELTGKIKFGTADEDEGLGTGENDYTLQLDLSKRFGMVTPFAGGGYKFIGDPSGVDLNDKWFTYAGLTARLHDRFNVGLAYDWSQSSVPGRGDFHELSPFATVKFGRHFAIDPYMLVGLSKPAADWGIGMQLRFIYDF